MLYYLFEWFRQNSIKVPGSALFQFITFRVLLAVLFSLVISMIFGKRLIQYLLKKQIGETVRDLGLAGEQQKKGTPTMGGFIIILAILIPTLLLADLHKAYIRLMLFSTIWLGIIGFIDDYLKLRAKRIAKQQGVAYKKGDKDGLAGWFKILGQVVLGLVVGYTLYFNTNTRVWREYVGVGLPADTTGVKIVTLGKDKKVFVEAREPITTIPFVKNHEFNYSKLLPTALRGLTWILYIIIVIFIVTTLALQALSPAQALLPAAQSVTQGAPAVASAVAAACANPNADASVVTAAEPAFPQGLKLRGTADVLVTIAPSGRVIHTTVLHSTGDSTLDNAVVVAARQSTYSPKQVSCNPVQGRYIFHVEFKPQ